MGQTVQCHACGAKSDIDGPVGREATCEQCNAYLHCCLNCTFYDTTAYNECAEPMAERVVDKDQANFCDYFKPGAERKAAGDSGQAAKQQLADLFKKK